MLSVAVLALLPTIAIAQLVGAESWAFLYPLVIMNATKTSMPRPYNAIFHKRKFADASDHTVVKPNVDTLYSSLWFDLPAGADVLTIDVPDTRGRYYVWQFMDMWTNTFLSIGSRTTGTSAQSFRLVGPGYTGPMDDSTFTAPTRNGWTILRILCNGPDDYHLVWALQNGFRVSYSGRSAPSLLYTQPLPPPDFVDAMGAQEFFEYASDVMAAGNMPKESDASMVSKLATIGVVPGEPFDWMSLSSSTKVSLTEGVDAAKKILKSMNNASAGGSSSAEWSGMKTVGNYSDHYLIRALVAYVGLGANIPEDAFYLHVEHGSDRNPLNGDRNYTITFGPGQLPPVNGFWSVTAYDANNYLIPNSADVYALGDRSSLVTALDGTTTIFLRASAPGDESLCSNWLPTPAGAAFTLTMRLYWPKGNALNGSWVAPEVTLEGSTAVRVLV